MSNYLKVEFTTKSKGILRGRLIQENHKTVWVRLLGGNIIKRHKIKHTVTAV